MNPLLPYLLEILLGVGAFLLTVLIFVLRGIRENQSRIWNWAREETDTIEKKIDTARQITDSELRDLRRWVRHEFRTMYGEMIELARLVGKAGADVEESIHNRLATWED